MTSFFGQAHPVGDSHSWANRPTDGAYLSRAALDAARENLFLPQPIQRVIMHPDMAQSYLYLAALTKVQSEIVQDEVLRAVWQAGWNARSKGASSVKRMNREWVRFSWAEANRREPQDKQRSLEDVHDQQRRDSQADA